MVSVGLDWHELHAVFNFSSDTGRTEEDGGYVIEFDGEENLDNGLWRLNLIKGGTRSELSLFDMQAIDPFTEDAAGAFIYYLPSVLIQADAASRIKSIVVSWYAWDPVAGDYRAVTDFTAFDALIRGYNVSIVSKSITASEDVTDQSSFVPVNAHYLENPQDGGNLVDWVRVGYTISGVEYFFTLYNE